MRFSIEVCFHDHYRSTSYFFYKHVVTIYFHFLYVLVILTDLMVCNIYNILNSICQIPLYIYLQISKMAFSFSSQHQFFFSLSLHLKPNPNSVSQQHFVH